MTTRTAPPDLPEHDLEIVDAHQHFWDLSHNAIPWLRAEPQIPFRYGDYSAIRTSYLPDDYRRDAVRQTIVQTVYIETEWDPADPVAETRWIHAIERVHGLPSAVVAQARLERPDVVEVLEAHRRFPLVRGIRQKPAAVAVPADARRNRPGSMDDPTWREGYDLLDRFDLTFDLQVPWWHLDEAYDLARDFPETTIILNHTGLPADRSPAGLAAWRGALATLAQAPNAALKISGLGQPDRPWTVADNGPIIREALAIFGPERCLFASNFPVDRLCATFDQIWDGFKSATRDLDRRSRSALFAANARRIYRLQEPSPPEAGPGSAPGRTSSG